MKIKKIPVLLLLLVTALTGCKEGHVRTASGSVTYTFIPSSMSSYRLNRDEKSRKNICAFIMENKNSMKLLDSVVENILSNYQFSIIHSQLNNFLL